MNEAFQEEILDMEAAERTAKELEECYFSDEDDLVVNKNARRKLSADEADQYSGKKTQHLTTKEYRFCFLL
jgi:hypothetical protein